MKQIQVTIKPFSVDNDYFVIDARWCYTCLVPVEQSDKYKAMFENCQTREEVVQIINSLKK